MINSFMAIIITDTITADISMADIIMAVIIMVDGDETTTIMQLKMAVMIEAMPFMLLRHHIRATITILATTVLVIAMLEHIIMPTMLIKL